MDGTRGFGSPWSVIDWWRGSKKLYHSVWEPPIMYLAWKVLRATLSFSLTGKACHPKYFSLSQFKPWALAPLQIPTSLCEGPIYLLYVILFLL